LHPTQDHFAGILKAIVAKDGGRRMTFRNIEHRGDLPLLGAMTDQRGVATPTERKCEGIKEDRFARACFSGQDCKPTGKLDIEPFDQDDVADRQTRQHARSVPEWWWYWRSLLRHSFLSSPLG